MTLFSLPRSPTPKPSTVSHCSPWNVTCCNDTIHQDYLASARTNDEKPSVRHEEAADTVLSPIKSQALGKDSMCTASTSNVKATADTMMSRAIVP